MKKNSIFLWLFAALLMASCSDKEVNGGGETAKGKVEITLEFDGTSADPLRAAASSTIPPTSWSTVKDLKFLLYNASGTKLLATLDPSANTGTKVYPYTDIPVGTYTVVAVGNAVATQSIVPYVGTAAETWEANIVSGKPISAFSLYAKAGTFPSFTSAAMTAAGNKAYTEPAEVFMGYASVVVNTTGTATATITLKREVSMMRIRLNAHEYAADTDNRPKAESAVGVDYATDASIAIYRLPAKLAIEQGNNGGYKNDASDPVKNRVLSIHGTDVFKTGDAPAGYSGDKKVVNDNDKFSMWRDIVIFPNNGGRQNDATPEADAAAQEQYYIVVSAQGQAGHVLANGTPLTAPTTIYWSGTVKGRFTPNTIRETNLKLVTGGTVENPVEPVEYGGLDIKVEEPAAWGTNIVDELILM